MKYIFIIVIPTLLEFSWIFKFENSGIEPCELPICIDIYGRCENLQIGDTVVINQNTHDFAKVLLYDCKGEMYIEAYKDSVLSLIGNYISAKSVSDGIVFVEDIETGEMKEEKSIKYFPKRNGTWSYFDKNNKIIKEEIYKGGELIETKEY